MVENRPEWVCRFGVRSAHHLAWNEFQSGRSGCVLRQTIPNWSDEKSEQICCMVSSFKTWPNSLVVYLVFVQISKQPISRIPISPVYKLKEWITSQELQHSPWSAKYNIDVACMFIKKGNFGRFVLNPEPHGYHEVLDSNVGKQNNWIFVGFNWRNSNDI